MHDLMNEITDTYNKRLLEYADKQEMFDIKLYVCPLLIEIIYNLVFSLINRLNGQYTLDNIASCLFGIETNSLQNENATLIKHLKTFFTPNIGTLFIFILCKCVNENKQTFFLNHCLFFMKQLYRD